MSRVVGDAGSVLVTGAAGFIGSHVVDRLLAGGWRVEAVDDLSSGSLANLDGARGDGQMRFHQMDVRAREFVDLVAKLAPDALIHMAGHVDRPGSLLDPLYDADVNVLGTLNVLESVRANDTSKFAIAVHGLFRREEPAAGRVIVGQAPMTPSHIACEAVVDYVRVHGDVYGLDVRVVAMSSVYGPRQRGATSGPVVASFAEAALEGTVLRVQGDGSQVRDFLFVDDAVDAIVRSLDAPTGSIIPIGSGVTTTIVDVAEAMIEISGTGAAIEFGPSRAIDRPGLPFPLDDARQRLDWRPWTSITEGLARTLSG